jgi:hypothetical protein
LTLLTLTRAFRPNGGCTTADLPAGPLNLNIFMESEKSGGWFPLVSNLELRKAPGAQVMAKIAARG